MQKNSVGFNSLVQHARKSSILSKEEEFELIKKWQTEEDPQSIKKILDSYLRLVIAIAKKYLHYGISQDDLINEGVIGMIHALKKFDLSKEFRLSTYASWWIRAMIQDFILKNWSIVKTGSTASQKALFFNLKKLKKQISDPSNEFFGEKELNIISGILKVKKNEIQNMEAKLTLGDQSLNQSIHEENGNVELLSLLKDDSPTPDKIIQDNHDGNIKKKWIQKSLEFLKERERLIIISRKLEEDAQTLDQLGKTLGISKERVRQIEKVALQKIKKVLLEISNEKKDFFLN